VALADGYINRDMWGGLMMMMIGGGIVFADGNVIWFIDLET